MSGPVRLEVPEAADGLRLDRWLAETLPGRSRATLQKWIGDGRVSVEGRAASKPSLPLRAGALVEVALPDPEPPGLVPEDIPVSIVYEDDAVAVVMKPAGLVVHPGHGRRSGTLVHALLGLGMPLAAAGGAERPGIVHRLDRETSGLLVVAKTDTAHRELAAAFASRRVRKRYEALVWGSPDPPDGRIERRIGRSRIDPTRMSTRVPRGREAVTVYRTVERIGSFTLVDVDLVTGRTHQIRVHFTEQGHPVVGDTRYGGSPWNGLRDPAARDAVRGFHRLALHAADIAFSHPVTRAPLAFHAPRPAEFENLLATLRSLP